MWTEYILPDSVAEAIHLLSLHGEKARIVAGATDLMLELERGVRSGIKTLIDITRISGLDQISLDENDIIHLGPLVTHNHCVTSNLLRQRAYPLARAAWEIGAPQIRNRGTVAGNLVTASPANDTISPLMALNAWVVLRSTRGERQVPLSKLYTGVRKSVIEPDEMLVEIAFPAMKSEQRGTFIKMGLRRAQAISIVNLAIIVTFESDRVKKASITLGAVAPTIIHAPEAETFLAGKQLDEEAIAQASELVAQSSRPIDDIRGSAQYRHYLVKALSARSLRTLRDQEESADFPSDPVLLWGSVKPVSGNGYSGTCHFPESSIMTRINGSEYTFKTGHEKNLLRLLREEAGLTGTKEGCAEGECGACTVFLDGKAVMACLVPAPRAHGAEIITIEGLAGNSHTNIGRRKKLTSKLHPVQEAFIQDGAVQCGYCTPGFVMAAAKLLEEKPSPTRAEIKHAITGNLCRCTGYYKIVQAIEDASKI